MKIEKSSIIPVLGVVGTFAFLFIIILLIYSFYKKELNEAIYTSVLTETKKRLETKVSSFFSLIKRESEAINESLRITLKENVDNAYLTSYSIYSYCKKRGCPDSAIKLLIKNSLKNYRFWHGNGYIFIGELKGKVVLNPFFPEIEGKNMWNWKDLTGTFVYRKFAEIALYSPNNEGFVSYHWYKPGTKVEKKGLAFVKLFKPYGWIIGGTVYAYQVEKELKRHVLSTGKALHSFVISYKDRGKFPFLKSLTLEQLKKGVFLTYRRNFYFISYYPKWKWIIGAYVPNSELLHQVYYLRKQFLVNANRNLLFSIIFVLAIIVLASVSLFKYNSKLNEIEIIEKLKKSRKELLRLTRSLRLTAYKDEVSGLFNRKKLIEDLSKIDVSRNIHFALINIRNFKNLNELFGFEEGDRVLREFGRELKRRVKGKCKECLVYRIRGDKFGLLACNFNDAQFIELVSKIIRELEIKEFEVGGIKFRLDVVAGISKSRENFLVESEIAEEEAKRKGVSLLVFDKVLEHKYLELENNFKIFNYLKEALKEDRVIPYFQPIQEISSGKIVKYEVLMRIETPEGILTPAQFLDVAKKIGIYRKISRTLIHKALEVAKEKGVMITLNLSSEDISDRNMVNWIIAALKRYGVADKVCFEVVETEAFSELKFLENFYHRVKELGAQLAIDDFGSGYSNYHYLVTIKPDFVKIDGSLISKLLESKEVEKMVRYIVMFCKDIGIETVGEFVSSKELYKKLKELGIDYAQGFYIGKPEPEIRV